MNATSNIFDVNLASGDEQDRPWQAGICARIRPDVQRHTRRDVMASQVRLERRADAQREKRNQCTTEEVSHDAHDSLRILREP